jgi:hypothetical protein
MKGGLENMVPVLLKAVFFVIITIIIMHMNVSESRPLIHGDVDRVYVPPSAPNPTIP